MPQNVSSEKRREERRKSGALFIPAGLFIGFGLGFLTGSVPAGMFLGLGAGFLLFAFVSITRK
jgi:hypothetical protein